MANVSNASNIALLVAIVGSSTFQGQCLNNLNKTTNKYSDWSNVNLRSENGTVLSGFGVDAWGISYDTCVASCSSNDISFPFDYNSFANAMTNYLLPWLALTAQLPYETGDAWANMMAFCMAVGSPVLITYSLALTILNRSWARKYFAALKLKATDPIVRRRAPDYDKRIDSARFLTQEAQQVPLRCSQERGWLASLIVLPQNIEWWERLQDRLRGTRRGFSPSLIAQMGLAVMAWFLTVIAAFHALLGDPTTALQIASSSLWIWLVPVIIGWILVGSQITDHSIEDSLRSNAFMAKESPFGSRPSVDRTMTTTQPDGPQEPVSYVEESYQQGIQRRGGLSPQIRIVSRSSTIATTKLDNGAVVNEEEHSAADLQVRGWLGFNVGGDEEAKGPTYNYARVFTWWQVVTTLGTALDTTLTRITEGQPCQDRNPIGNPMQQTKQSVPEPMEFRAASKAISQYCGLDAKGSCKQYPEWSELPADVFRRILAATASALFVQWGTAGASIMTAYLTPTKGLGCRSGSYVVYASTSTVAWLCLLLASLFSHQAMLLYQSHIINQNGTGFRRPSVARIDNPGEYHRPLKHTLICAAAAIFRVLGKMLCVLNSLWLLLTSLLEFVGVFDNCWCLSNYPSSNGNGTLVLFKTASDLAKASVSFWAGGLAWIVLAVSIAIVIFAMGTYTSDTE